MQIFTQFDHIFKVFVCLLFYFNLPLFHRVHARDNESFCQRAQFTFPLFSLAFLLISLQTKREQQQQQ